MHAIFVATAAQPQYFVVTPKLLPGLRYGSGITVLLVLNGRHNELESGGAPLPPPRSARNGSE